MNHNPAHPRWEPLAQRKYTLLSWRLYVDGLVHPLMSVTGKKGFDLIIDGVEYPQYMFCDRTQLWEQFQDNFWRLFIYHPQEYYRAYKKTAQQLERFAHSIKRLDADRLSNKQLVQKIQRVQETTVPFFGLAIFGIFLGDYVVSDELIERLLGRISPGDKAALLTPPKIAAHFKEERLLQAINPGDDRAMRAHAAQWFWIPCVELTDEPWTVADFIKRAHALKAHPPTVDLAKRRQRLRTYRRFIQNLPAAKRAVAEAIHLFTYLKDHRDDVRFEAIAVYRELYRAAARRLKLRFEEVLLLQNNELMDYLRKPNASAVREVIAKRAKGWLLHLDPSNRITLLDGAQAQKFHRTMLQPTLATDATHVSGIIANSGIVQGVVRIVKTEAELGNITKGSIMIAPFTRPSYLTAMRKAAAFVTDEGGLTSHAAIVARELGVPCIVGCKTATRVFKDGELVEVNADTGEVRKLK